MSQACMSQLNAPCYMPIMQVLAGAHLKGEWLLHCCTKMQGFWVTPTARMEGRAWALSTGSPCLTFRSKEEGHHVGVQMAWDVRLLQPH